MKLALAAIFALAFVFTALPSRAADCLYGELPDGGCKPAPGATPTPRPSATRNPSATPRPQALTATVRCNPASHNNEITVTVTATGPTNVWTESDLWAFKIEASGTGNYTKVIVHSATFNKMDIELRTASGVVLGSAVVHAVWGAAGPGC